MSAIRIFGSDLVFLGEIFNYEKLTYKRGYFEPKKFILEIDYTKLNAEYLVVDNFIVIGKKKNKIAIIEYSEKIVARRGGETKNKLIIKGREAITMLGWRIIIPPSGNAQKIFTSTKEETIIKTLIDENIINAVDTDRNISILNLVADSSRGSTIDKRYRYKNLVDEIVLLLKDSIFGISATINTTTNKIDLDIYEGLNRTKDQSVNSPAIFGIKFGNITEQMLLENKFNLRNVAYTGGTGEGASRIIEEVGTDTGLDRREIFIDARDITNTTELAERGQEKLNVVNVDRMFRNEIKENANLEYEVDYDLGDIITTMNEEWDVIENKRITSITEIYKKGKIIELEVEFGDKIPDLIDILKAKFKNTDDETTR